ncbi:type IV pilin protein [Cyanobacterium sp. Dongsha4]|uniref:type IV pilin protein n=1 Tax=Cyanobacterium sp. DS4 TaxID=2878255 RepID=UPI002E82306D|nr:type IV pilin-like G/H family protein [Cyanobacterium sp. Dongsha4]WVL02228.1 prepilin-type N-terminal cleavage/methylation domain-containing protein [Cyanobacterium sp. Dongsha4]
MSQKQKNRKRNLKKRLFFSHQVNTRGFTLIELLVVIIIVGVLGAVALPNFLRQVGKSREVEMQNLIGAINRAQQAYHFEKQNFAEGTDDNDSLTKLGLTFDSNYIDSYNIIANTNSATTTPTNTNYDKDGTRAYSGGMFYNAGVYKGATCRSEDVASSIPAPSVTFVPPSVDCGVNVSLQ